MKVESNSAPVVMSGAFQTASYTIKATGKAFRILSSGLYSDKILAIIRELSCNARDSHVAARRADIPFIIHLPNVFEPYFSVKDMGLGLSHEDVYGRAVWKVNIETGEEYIEIEGGLFRIYFESTKTDSNDFVGALGLGSKSPFSYVDSYTVVSVFDGKRRTYNAYIANAGVPDITLLTTEDTDEHNGLEIIIPVKTADYKSFHDKCAQALKYFDVLPQFVGGQWTPDFFTPEYSIEGSTWKILKSRDKKPVAIMGGIAYPIDGESITGISPQELTMLSLPLELYFNIGELDFAASRESLSYDVPTINILRERLTEIYDHLRSSVEKDFYECKTEWEARIKFRHHFNTSTWNPISHAFGPLVTNNQLAITWNGKTVNNVDVKIPKKMLGNRVDIKLFGILKRNSSASEVVREVVQPHSADTHIPCQPNVHFVFDDMTRGGRDRMRNHVMNTKGTIVYATFSPVIMADKKRLEREIKNLICRCGHPANIVRTSQLPPPVRAVNKVKNLLMYNHYSSPGKDGTSRSWIAHSNGTSGLYVPVKIYQPVDGNGTTIGFNLTTFITRLIDIGILTRTTKIFGVRPADLKAVKNSENWINLFDYARDEINDMITSRNMNDSVVNITEVNQVHEKFKSMFGYDWKTKIEDQMLPKINKDTVFAKFVKIANDVSASMPKIEKGTITTLRLAATSIGIKFDTSKTVSLGDELHKMLKKYPMLKFLNANSISTEGIGHVIDYISTVDQK